MKQSIAFLVLCLLMGSTLMASETPIVDTADIPALAADSLSADLPEQGRVSLMVLSSDFGLLLEQQIGAILLQRGVEIVPDGETHLNVQHTKSADFLEQPGLLGTRKIPVLRHDINLRVTQQGKVTAYRYVSFFTESGSAYTSSWFDPVLVSIIIGGLIYLFYYGSDA